MYVPSGVMAAAVASQRGATDMATQAAAAPLPKKGSKRAKALVTSAQAQSREVRRQQEQYQQGWSVVESDPVSDDDDNSADPAAAAAAVAPVVPRIKRKEVLKGPSFKDPPFVPMRPAPTVEELRARPDPMFDGMMKRIRKDPKGWADEAWPCNAPCPTYVFISARARRQSPGGALP